MIMKTVIFGGTFNPVHNGHLNVIRSVINELSPERFIVMPTGIPPHKQASDLASDSDRLEMLKLAVADLPEVIISDYEIQKGGRSYTYETLGHLRAVYPDDDLYFVMGTDMLSTFLSWRNPDVIMSLATLVGISRDDGDAELIRFSAERIIEAGGRCILINCEPYEASSTEIRNGIKNGESCELLPASVYDYIKLRGLYNA